MTVFAPVTGAPPSIENFAYRLRCGNAEFRLLDLSLTVAGL